jgi:hypothetical protein
VNVEQSFEASSVLELQRHKDRDDVAKRSESGDGVDGVNE